MRHQANTVGGTLMLLLLFLLLLLRVKWPILAT